MPRSLLRFLLRAGAGWAVIGALSGAASCSDPNRVPCTDFCEAALRCDVPSTCAIADQGAVLDTCRSACEGALADRASEDSAAASCVGCVGGETVRVSEGGACGLSPQVIGKTDKTILENCGCQTHLTELQSAVVAEVSASTCTNGRPVFGWTCGVTIGAAGCKVSCSLPSTKLEATCSGSGEGPLTCACAAGKTFSAPSCLGLAEDRTILDRLWETCR